ncbi:unnamed protein product, partial [Polarella glacialis]
MDAPCCVGVVRDSSSLVGKDITVGKDLPAYYSAPKLKSGKRMGIVVVHDIFGTAIPNCKYIVDHFASKGFDAVMPDFYTGKEGVDPAAWPADKPMAGEDFGKWFGSISSESYWEKFKADVEDTTAFLRRKGCIRFAIIGFCWGGIGAEIAAKTGRFAAAVGFLGGVAMRQSASVHGGWGGSGNFPPGGAGSGNFPPGGAGSANLPPGGAPLTARHQQVEAENGRGLPGSYAAPAGTAPCALGQTSGPGDCASLQQQMQQVQQMKQQQLLMQRATSPRPQRTAMPGPAVGPPTQEQQPPVLNTARSQTPLKQSSQVSLHQSQPLLPQAQLLGMPQVASYVPPQSQAQQSPLSQQPLRPIFAEPVTSPRGRSFAGAPFAWSDTGKATQPAVPLTARGPPAEAVGFQRHLTVSSLQCSQAQFQMAPGTPSKRRPRNQTRSHWPFSRLLLPRCATDWASSACRSRRLRQAPPRRAVSSRSLHAKTPLSSLRAKSPPPSLQADLYAAHCRTSAEAQEATRETEAEKQRTAEPATSQVGKLPTPSRQPLRLGSEREASKSSTLGRQASTASEKRLRQVPPSPEAAVVPFSSPPAVVVATVSTAGREAPCPPGTDAAVQAAAAQ